MTDLDDTHPIDVDDFFADVEGPPPHRQQAAGRAKSEPIALTVEQLTTRHPRVPCTAHSSRTGQPCRAWAMRGSTVCSAHGGMAPQVRDAADRRVMIAQAIRLGDRMPDRPTHLVPSGDDDDEMAEWAAGVLTAVRTGKRWR